MVHTNGTNTQVSTFCQTLQNRSQLLLASVLLLLLLCHARSASMR
jgi:hypothetical protein